MKNITRVTLVLLGIVLLQVASGRATKSMIGEPLPPLSVTYLREKPDLTGKPLILEFWATWCPPCRASIPHLNEIYKKYKDRGLMIVGVSDEPKSKVEAFLKTTPMDYSPALDAGKKLNKEFGINAIPHAVLVNKEGKVVWEGHPMQLKDADIEAVLK